MILERYSTHFIALIPRKSPKRRGGRMVNFFRVIHPRFHLIARPLLELELAGDRPTPCSLPIGWLWSRLRVVRRTRNSIEEGGFDAYVERFVKTTESGDLKCHRESIPCLNAFSPFCGGEAFVSYFPVGVLTESLVKHVPGTQFSTIGKDGRPAQNDSGPPQV